MITKEKINELRSEAARVGYHNLNLAPVMHHAKSAVQKAYIDQKKTLSMRIKRYLSVRDSISKHTTKLKQQMKNTIIDSGDMLSRLTNDVIPATTHRVINPDSDNSSRFSMPFFVHPNPEAVLKCLPSCIGKGAKYPDILANDFLLQRLKEIGLLK